MLKELRQSQDSGLELVNCEIITRAENKSQTLHQPSHPGTPLNPIFNVFWHVSQLFSPLRKDDLICLNSLSETSHTSNESHFAGFVIISASKLIWLLFYYNVFFHCYVLIFKSILGALMELM